MRFSLPLSSLILMSGFLVGCGQSTPSGKVQGTVTLKGQPVKQGQVTLFSEPGRPISSAPISDLGSFEFAEPVPVGKYQVAILPPAEELPAGAEPVGKTNAKQVLIPPKFRNEATSQLQADIQAGDNTLKLTMP